MKYLAYDPITLIDFDYTAEGFRYYSNEGVEQPHVLTPKPFSNQDQVDGVINLIKWPDIDVSSHINQGTDDLLASNDSRNIEQMKSLIQSINDVNLNEDIPDKSKLQFLTPYKTSLCTIFMDELKHWLNMIKDTLVVSNLEIISKQFFYCKSLMNIISRYEPVSTIQKWLCSYIEIYFAQFISDIISFRNCIAHEVFTHANLLQNPEKAEELFDINLKIMQFVKETGINIKLDLDFAIEDVNKTLENLIQFTNHIISSKNTYPHTDKRVSDFKNLSNNHQKCYRDINNGIFYCFYRKPEFYFSIQDPILLNKLKSMSSFVHTSFLEDPKVCSALCIYVSDAIFMGKLKDNFELSSMLEKLETLLHTKYSALVTIIKTNIPEMWYCLLRLTMQEDYTTKNIENAYYLYLTLFKNDEVNKLDKQLRAQIQAYFETNLLDLYRPQVGYKLRTFVMNILKNKEMGFDLREFLDIQSNFEEAPVLKSTSDGVEIIVRPTQIDPDSYDSLAKNRKVKIPSFVRQTINQLVKSFTKKNMVFKHNISYHLIELMMNIEGRKIKIICSPSIYAILSAFESRDSCEFNQLMLYTKLKPNQFKSSLQRLRNAKLLFVKSGHVELNMSVSDLPNKIIVTNSRRITK